MSAKTEVQDGQAERKDAPSAYRMEQAMSALLAARARLLEEDPELAGDERLLADMLDGETAEGTMEVLHRMVRAAVHADDMAEACERRSAILDDRRKRWAKRGQGMRAAVFSALDALGLKKLPMPDCTVTVRAGQPGVIVTDEAAVPEAFMRVRRSPSLSAIKAALEAGEDVPGCVLANAMPSLSIRTK